MNEAANRTDTALITGASSGIGEALAGCFAAAGIALVLVARRTEKLEALAQSLRNAHGIKASVLGADLSQPNAAPVLAQQLKRRRIDIDILVNNAGVLTQGSFSEMPAAEHRAMVELNVLGLTALLTEFVPGMKARGHGRVLNVASIAAFQPVPGLATYAATKAYVLSLSESLSEELRDTGVTVTALCPGITATPMLNQAADANDRLTRLPGVLVSDVQAVAAEGFAACMRGDAVLVPGVLNRAAMVAGRAIPKWLLRRIAGVVTRQIQ